MALEGRGGVCIVDFCRVLEELAYKRRSKQAKLLDETYAQLDERTQ
jgi:hypothetical protein